MNLREALITMSPSLELQRAAANEIARLDALVKYQEGEIRVLKALVEHASPSAVHGERETRREKQGN